MHHKNMPHHQLCLSSPTCILYNNLPIICSLLVLSPYLYKFISFFFISPLHFSLLLLFIFATSLYHYKTILHKLGTKLIEEKEEEDEEFRDFEQSELYNIVFDAHHPTLINSDSNSDKLEEALVMENPEKKMERLFEELDRFEDHDSTAISVSRQNIQTADLEACSSESENLETSKMFRRLESIKSDLEKASAMTTTTTTTTTNSAKDLQTNENENASITVKSIISRLESSTTTFGSYRLTKLDLEEVSSTAISTSGDDENTLKSSSESSPSFGSFDSPKSDPEETEDRKNVENSVKSSSNSMQVELDSCNSSFGSYGSMRKEKEWKRTLACKLFEERRSLEGGGEGMDSLWESYEDDNTNRKSKNSKKKTNVKINNKAKSEFKYFDDGVSEDGDEDDEFMGNGQLCCLKALKLSTGKMNLGMGKPNLVKISRALKGFGWLHHKHAKKC